MDHQPIEIDNFIPQALKLLDPGGSLKPGTEAYDTICCMIRGWIREFGPNRALCMARLGAKHLDGWRKFL